MTDADDRFECFSLEAEAGAPPRLLIAAVIGLGDQRWRLESAVLPLNREQDFDFDAIAMSGMPSDLALHHYVAMRVDALDFLHMVDFERRFPGLERTKLTARAIDWDKEMPRLWRQGRVTNLVNLLKRHMECVPLQQALLELRLRPQASA